MPPAPPEGTAMYTVMPCEKDNYYHRNYGQKEQAKGKNITNKIKQVCNRDIGFYKVF